MPFIVDALLYLTKCVQKYYNDINSAPSAQRVVSSMKKSFFFVLVNIAIFCTLIVALEAAGQIYYYIKHGKFVFQTSVYDNEDSRLRTFEIHPYLAGRLKKNVTVRNVENSKEIKTTSIHTRWTGAPEDDRNLIRVAVLGGSTTFGSELTDSDSWPALLQSKLGDEFSVINYGVPGYSTAEAIIQMGLIVPESKPQFVVLYEGWNDIHNYHEEDLGADYYVQGMGQYDNLAIPIYREKTVFEKLYELSAIIRLMTKLKWILSEPPDNRPCPKFDSPDPFVDKMYVRNLNTLKLLSERIDYFTLFVPQVLNYKAYLEQEDREACNHWVWHVKYSAMPRLMDRLNSLMQSVCTKDDSKCVFVDSVLKVKWEADDFIDFGHFSKKGGEKFADVISQVILSRAKEGKYLQ